MRRGQGGWAADWFAHWMLWESIQVSEWFSCLEMQLHQEEHQFGALPLGGWSRTGVEFRKQRIKEFSVRRQLTICCAIKSRQVQFSPFMDAPCVVDLSRTVRMGRKYSRKERKNYSVRKACWILPLLWGQIFIWSQLGVSWSCVSLQQPRSCPLARPVLGLGSSSFWRVFHPSYPVNPPPGQPVPVGCYAGCWLWSRLVIRQNCSLLMSFTPRKKNWSWYWGSKHKAQKWKKLLTTDFYWRA